MAAEPLHHHAGTRFGRLMCSGFVDVIGERGLLGHVEGRNANSAADWLSTQPASRPEQIRYVDIDLCHTFRAAAHRALL